MFIESIWYLFVTFMGFSRPLSKTQAQKVVFEDPFRNKSLAVRYIRFDAFFEIAMHLFEQNSGSLWPSGQASILALSSLQLSCCLFGKSFSKLAVCRHFIDQVFADGSFRRISTSDVCFKSISSFCKITHFQGGSTKVQTK